MLVALYLGAMVLLGLGASDDDGTDTEIEIDATAGHTISLVVPR